MKSLSLLIAGAQGQGINSIGDLLASSLRDSGRWVFAYREYMSLIKGGHSTYQIDVSEKKISSTSAQTDILLCLDHHGLEKNTRQVRPNGLILHCNPEWSFSESDTAYFAENSIQVIPLDIEKHLKENAFPAVVSNMILGAILWSVLDLDRGLLERRIRERFASKKPEVTEMNIRAIEVAGNIASSLDIQSSYTLPGVLEEVKDAMLLTGSQALGMGVVSSGCRVFAGYPMTPASPLLTYLAEVQNETGMVIKQAEDEITAAQIASGANAVGTRAMTATSGGGFDLMAETVSMNGIMENPCVIALAMRPGPGTGLPTWTAQGDLSLAIYSGHGEFARCVLSVSDSADAFETAETAFTIAEEFQIPVILLYDKQIAEGIYTQEKFVQKAEELQRGSKLLTNTDALAKTQSSNRYDPSSDSGVSSRWLPGVGAAGYCLQGDEHSADGSVDETAGNAIEQMDKRMRKLEALRESLPDPDLYIFRDGSWQKSGNPEALDTLIVTWGSTKRAILDSVSQPGIGVLHFGSLWPLRTDRFVSLYEKANRTMVIEGNYTGQLAKLLTQESGIVLQEIHTKYDGRPFFREDISSLFVS